MSTQGSTPLYELVRYQRELEALADSGEIPPEQIAETLELIKGDVRDKAVNVAAFTRNLEASASAIREAANAMKARAERLEKRAESIRQYLLFQLQVASILRIECPWFTLAVRKNPPSVSIDDESKIPEEYLIQPLPPPKRPDKPSIARALKAGEDVPGARLIDSDRLEIKP